MYTLKIFAILSLSWAVTMVSQPANACPTLQNAIESYFQRKGINKSVAQAKHYQVNYACNSTEDCNDGKLPVGTAFRVFLTFQYSGAVVTLPEFYSQLLIYDSKRQLIIDEALSSWMESVRARALPQRGWGKFQAKFDSLFLTRELPEGSQLIMLAEHQNVVTYHSRPIASVASSQGLSAPIETAILESLPPRIKWTLKLKKPIGGDIFVRWYVKDVASGDIIDADDFVTPSNSPNETTLTIVSSADDRWTSNSCRMLNVHIDRNPVGDNREVFRQPTIVATRFGSEC